MKRRNKSKMKRAGVTLAEVLIAMAALSVTLLAVVGLQTSILKGRQKSQVNVHAAKLASQILVRTEAQLASDIDLDVTQARIPVPPEILNPNPYNFEYEVTQSFDGPPSDGLKDVSVTVFWEDKNGPQRRTLWSKFIES